VSGGQQSSYHSRSWLNQEGGILSRELFSSSVIFFVCFEIVDLLFTIAGIDINKLTITPNANVDISTKAKEPSNFQIRKVTPTGIGFCNAKMTVKMASPNARISNNCIARSSFRGPPSCPIFVIVTIAPRTSFMMRTLYNRRTQHGPTKNEAKRYAVQIAQEWIDKNQKR
jgi:hypothetical protein